MIVLFRNYCRSNKKYIVQLNQRAIPNDLGQLNHHLTLTLTSGTLTGKTYGFRKSCEVNFSYSPKERSKTSCEVHFSNLAKSVKNPLQNYGGLTDETGALAGPPAGLTQEQWNLATVFMFHYWSDSTGNKMTFHDSVAS